MASKMTQKVYEVSFHLLPTLSEEEAGSVFSSVESLISSDGEVLDTVSPELMDLAYPVRHSVRQEDGSYARHISSYFCSVKFRSPPSFVVSLQKYLQDDNSALRFLVVETVAEDTRIGSVLPGSEVEEDSKSSSEEQGSTAGEKNVASSDSDSSEEQKDTVSATSGRGTLSVTN